MVDELEFFRAATLKIAGTLDIRSALATTFEFLRQHIPMDALGLGYFDRESNRICTLAETKLPRARYVRRNSQNPEIELSQVLIDILMAPKDKPWVKILNTPADLDNPEWLKAFPGLVDHSAISLTLDMHGQDIGVLFASVQGQPAYDQEHADLLAVIREPFAIAMSNGRRYQELSRLKDRLAEDHHALRADLKRAMGTEVVGADFGLREVMSQVRQIANSNSPTLLLGETGTGKEVIANAIHAASSRNQGPLISMQCGAVPDPLLDSELFGHEKGAFTGAHERKRGRFERAHGGTLFLDEIGELSPEAQVKLLRFLQERQLERIGGSEPIEVDVRVIAATHRDLETMVRDGKFREDLWYRLNVLPIRIPPLRLRRQDIPSLVQYFVTRKAGEMNLPYVPSVPGEEINLLQAYDWPGNVRELQNVVERAMILSQSGSLSFQGLLTDVRRPPVPNAVDHSAPPELDTMDSVVAKHIRFVLDRVNGQIAGKGGAAEVLGLNPSTLRFRMKKLGMS